MSTTLYKEQKHRKHQTKPTNKDLIKLTINKTNINNRTKQKQNPIYIYIYIHNKNNLRKPQTNNENT